MKKNKKLLIIILLAVMLLPVTGCTKYLKDSDGKNIQNKETGQNAVKNILCQPTDKEMIKIYKENKINVEELPKCTELSIVSGGYEGIWTTIFVKPLAWIIVKIGELVNNYGIAIILITILIRGIMYPMTKKTAMQSENMQKAKPELDRLEKKYRNVQDQQQMMQKSQEMLMIYKKYDIHPMSGCVFSLFQIPLFFAFYEALNRLPAVFEGELLGLQLGMSPLTAISQGKFIYVLVIAAVILVTTLSFKLNRGANLDGEQAKMMNKMMKMSIVMIGAASFTISTSIALYWIFNSGFTIVQNLIVKRRKANA